MKANLLNNLQSYADERCEDHQLPGISIAIKSKGELFTAASGVLNLDTQVKSTPDSVFQIGSITKVFTTTLIMQLVDKGRIELDRPVIDYLADFKVASDYATHNITVRQLLNHTSGLEGDFFAPDKPSGGNHLARYVDRCDLLPQSHKPGDYFAYSNSAFCIAGRLLEVVTGKSWYTLIKQNIVEPVGLRQAVVDGSESSLFRVARAHVASEGEQVWKIAHEGFPRGMDPVGASLAMSASDLVRFAQAHVDASQGANTQWLSQSSSQAMQSPEVSLPLLSASFITDWGLGWSLYRDHPLNVFGHDGGTIGQCALLRVVPEHDLIFAVMANCDLYTTLLHKLFSELMSTLTGFDYVEASPANIYLNLDNYCGDYHSMGQEHHVYLEQGVLKCRVVIKTAGNDLLDFVLKPINHDCFAVFMEGGERSFNMHFLFDKDASAPHHLFAFNRLNQRVA